MVRPITRPWTPQEPVQEPETGAYNLDLDIESFKKEGIGTDYGPEEWAKLAQEFANETVAPVIFDGKSYLPPPPEPEEEIGHDGAIEVLSGANKGIRDRLAIEHEVAEFSQFFIDYMPLVETNKDIRETVDIIEEHSESISGNMKDDEIRSILKEIGSTEEQINSAFAHVEDYHGRKGNRPAIAAMMNSQERAKALMQIYGLHGIDGLETAGLYAMGIGDRETAEMVALSISHHQQTVVAHAFRGETGAVAVMGPGLRTWSDTLGERELGEWESTEGMLKAPTHQFPILSEDDPAAYGAIDAMIKKASELAVSRGHEKLSLFAEEMSTEDARKVAIAAADYLDKTVLDKSMKIELATLGGGETGAQSLSKMIRVLDAYQQKFPDRVVDYSNIKGFLGDAQRALLELDESAFRDWATDVGMTLLEHAVAVFGFGSRMVGGWMSGNEHHRPVAFVFPDGKVYDSWADATNHSMMLRSAGAVDEEDPRLRMAQHQYRKDNGLLGIMLGGSRAAMDEMLTKRGIERDDPSITGQKISETQYARPTILLRKSEEEKSWTEKLGRAWDGITDTDSNYTFNVLRDNWHAGLYEDNAGRGSLTIDAFLFDLIIDPINLLAMGPKLATGAANKAFVRELAKSGNNSAPRLIKAVERIMGARAGGEKFKTLTPMEKIYLAEKANKKGLPRLAEIAMNRPQAKARKLSERRKVNFADGTTMTGEWVAMQDAMRISLGGGVGAEEIAQDLLTMVAHDPGILNKGVVEVLRGNLNKVAGQLRSSGMRRPQEFLDTVMRGERITEDITKLSTRRQSQLRHAANRLWAKSVMDEALPQMRRLTEALPGVVNNKGWGKVSPWWRSDVHSIDDIVSRQLHQKAWGFFVKGTRFGIPANKTKFTRWLSDSLSDATNVIRQAGSAKKVEALKAKGVYFSGDAMKTGAAAAMRRTMDSFNHITSVFSADRFSLQQGKFGAPTPKIPWRLRKIFEFQLRRRLAADAMEVPPAVGEILSVKTSKVLTEGDAPTISIRVMSDEEDIFITHFLESGGESATEAADYVIKHWRTIKGKHHGAKKGFKEAAEITDKEKIRVREIAERLWPNVEQAKLRLAQSWDDTIGSGLGTSAEEVEHYVLHIFTGTEGKKLSKLSADQMEKELAGMGGMGRGVEVQPGTSMRERLGPATIVEAKRLGLEPVESGAAVLLSTFLRRANILTREGFKASVIDTFGVLGVRGQEALTRMLAHSDEARWAFEPRLYENGLERFNYKKEVENLNAQAAEVHQALKNFNRIKQMLGVGTATLAGGKGLGAALLNSEKFLQLAAAKPTNKLLDKALHPTLRRFLHKEAKNLLAVRREMSDLRAKLGPFVPAGKRLESMTAKEFSVFLADVQRLTKSEISAELALKLHDAEIISLKDNIFYFTREAKEVAVTMKKIEKQLEKLRKRQGNRIERLQKVRPATEKTALRQYRKLHQELQSTNSQIRDLEKLKDHNIKNYDYGKPSKEIAAADKAKLKELIADRKGFVASTKAEVKAVAKDKKITGRAVVGARESLRSLLKKASELAAKEVSAEKRLARVMSHNVWETTGRYISSHVRTIAASEHNLRQSAAATFMKYGPDSAHEARRLVARDLRMDAKRKAKKKKATDSEVVAAYNAAHRKQKPAKKSTESMRQWYNRTETKKKSSVYEDPRFERVDPKDVDEYRAIESMFKELGMNPEQQAFLLWDFFRVTDLTHVPVEEMRVLLKEGQVKLGRFMIDPDAAVAFADPTAGLVKGRETYRFMASPKTEAAKQVDKPAGVAKIWEDMKGKQADPLKYLVRAVEEAGGTAAGQRLMNVYIPAEMGIQIKTMLNEAIDAKTVGESLFRYGAVMNAFHKMSMFFKGVVTSGKLDQSFHRRNWLDGVKGMVQTQTWAYFDPAFRARARAFIEDGGGISTPGGETIFLKDYEADIHRNLFSSFPAKWDLEAQSLYSNLARQTTEGGEQLGKLRERLGSEAEEYTRTKGMHISGGSVRGGIAGGALGQLSSGIEMGMVGAGIGYSVGLASESMIRGWSRGARGRMSTQMERLVPMGLPAAEALENDFRVYYFVNKLENGSGIKEALEDVNTMWRDYTNMSPQEKGIVRNIPVLFYNFTKQNTIAQLARTWDNPAYGAWWMKTLNAMSDDLPQEHKAPWLHALNSFSRGPKVYFQSDEFAAPFEALEPIFQMGLSLTHALGITETAGNLGRAMEGLERTAPPFMRGIVEMTDIGSTRPFRFYDSIAKEYYDSHTEVDENGRKTVSKGWFGTPGKDAMGRHYLEIDGVSALLWSILGLEVAAKVVMNPLKNMHEGNYFHAALQWAAGIRAYDKKLTFEHYLQSKNALVRKFAEHLEGFGTGPFAGTLTPPNLSNDHPEKIMTNRLIRNVNAWSRVMTQWSKVYQEEAKLRSRKPGLINVTPPEGTSE